MTNQMMQSGIIKYIETSYNSGITLGGISYPPQGMSSSVFFIRLKGLDCAVKYGKDAMKDIPALKVIEDAKVNVPIPKLVESFIFDGIPVIILQKIEDPLYESVSGTDMPKYVPAMISVLNELHKIKSNLPGLLGEVGKKSWKNILMSVFEGEHFYWKDISEREGLDKDLILMSVKNMKNKIKSINFDLKEYSLLHTDFNQRNLFVNTKKGEIAAVIDWEDAMYGDPLYDFARVRMYMWHFNFPANEIENYYKLVGFTSKQRNLEELYWLSRVIQYLAWYSEELTEFNISRIKLHQEYLRNYKW